MGEGGVGICVSISGRVGAAGIVTDGVGGGVTVGVTGRPAAGDLFCPGELPTENLFPLWSRNCKLSNSNSKPQVFFFFFFFYSSDMSFIWTVCG